MSAVDRYDPTGFSNFHSYASRWIQQRIQRDCNPTWALYSYPAQIKVKMFIALQKYKAQTNGEDIGSQLYYELVSRIAGQIELSETDIDKAIQYEYKQKYERIRVDDVVFSEDNVKDNLPAEFIENEEKVFFQCIKKNL